MKTFWRIYDAAARWSDRIAVPIVCGLILLPVFFGEWLEAIGRELLR